MEKGTKFIWPKTAKRIWYSVEADIRREGSIKGGECYDTWHNGEEYTFLGRKTLFGEEYIVFDNNKKYEVGSAWWVRKKDFEEIFPNTKINNMDLTKKGTLFTIPSKPLLYSNINWLEGNRIGEKRKDIGRNGKQKTFGTKQIGGETWVLYDEPHYSGSDYWMSPLKELNLLLNIKNEEKTMTKITVAKAKIFPFSQLKSGSQFYSKQTGNGEIYIQGKKVYIVHNHSSNKHGSRPSPMPAGFSYGWYLGELNTTIDLTYKGDFTGIQIEEAKEKEVFKNTFLVKGTPALVKAFKEEALEAGWTFKGSATSTIYKNLYFCHKGDTIHSGAHFRLDGEACTKSFSLPSQWDLAIKTMKEKEVLKEKVEYIKFNVDGQESDGLVKGRFYKVAKKLDKDTYEVFIEGQNTIEVWKGEWTAAKKSDFDAQKTYVGHIGGYKVNIQTVKIRGYNDMKVACIGCRDSEQVYTVGALKTLRDVMESKFLKKAKNDEEGVEFTLEQVKALLEACE